LIGGYAIPRRIWPTRAVPTEVTLGLRRLLVAEALVESQDIERRRAPAIVILAPEDIRNPSEDVVELLDKARPGRPILLGGTQDRAVLAKAINEFRVHRVLPSGIELSLIAAALKDAHEEVEVGAALEMLATNLRGETARVASAIHDLRRTQSDLLHTERLSTIGRLTGGLVQAVDRHQVVVKRFAQVLDAEDPELHRLANAAVDGTHSVGALLEEIESYAAGTERRFRIKVEDLDSVVRGAVAFARFDELSTARTLTIDLESRAHVSLDRYAMYQVIVNLVRNALQATKPGGVVEVRTYRGRGVAVLEVEDNGVGMTSEVRSRMFEPFFSTRGEEGLGLGLRAVRSIIRQHDGTVEVLTREGRGTRVQVRLPVETV
jgi:signal transduction histidine kinase